MVDSNNGQWNPEKEPTMMSASDRSRAVWSTPKVIESRLSDSQASVTIFTDGTSPTSGISYGS